MVLVQIKKAYPGHARRVMMGVWSHLRQFMYYPSSSWTTTSTSRQCGMTVMRRWMTQRKSSRTGQLTGIGRRNRHRTLMSISVSVGDQTKRQL